MIKDMKYKHPDVSEYQKARETCRHKNCTECNGTGLTRSGHQCIHMIACYCKWCCPF